MQKTTSFAHLTLILLLNYHGDAEVVV